MYVTERYCWYICLCVCVYYRAWDVCVRFVMTCHWPILLFSSAKLCGYSCGHCMNYVALYEPRLNVHYCITDCNVTALLFSKESAVGSTFRAIIHGRHIITQHTHALKSRQKANFCVGFVFTNTLTRRFVPNPSVFSLSSARNNKRTI